MQAPALGLVLEVNPIKTPVTSVAGVF